MATYQLIKTVGSSFGTLVSPMGGKRTSDGYAEPLSLASDNSLFVNVSNSTLAVTQSGTWTVAGSGTFTVSGTVTANIGTTNGLALDATVSGLHVAQGSTTSGQTGALIQGAVTTSAPSYTTAKTSPLSLTTSGLLRVDGSGVTQPVSGTVTANAGSGTFTVSGTVTANQGGTWTVQPGNTANTTPWLTTINQGGNSAAVTGSNALKVDGSAVTQPVSGTITANAGSGNFTVVQATASSLNATIIGTGTDNTTNSTAKLPTLSAKANTSAPTWTDGYMVPLSVDTSGNLRTSGTSTVSGTVAATQSGTWTVQQGSAPWSVVGIRTNNTATPGSNHLGVLPAVASSAAQSYTDGYQVLLSTDLSGNLRTSIVGTATISGTVTANQGGSWTIQPLTNSSIVKAQLQDNAGNALNSTSNALNVNIQNSSIAVTGTFWQATQPVSGTVAVSNSFALDTSVNGILLAQNSTTSGQTGPLVQGAVTTSAPSYTTAKTSPLSLTTAGALRVDNSANTQPVSGTVAATQSGTWTVQPGNTQNTTAWLTQDAADGSVAAGTAASKAMLIGAQYNTSLPSLTNTQQSALQADSSGRLLVGSIASALPTGANVIGAVTQSAGPWTQNVTQFGGNNVVTGTGAGGSGIPRVTVSNDSNVLATQSGTWTAVPNAATSGGSDGYRILSAANTTTLTVKSSAGQIYAISMINTNASARFVKLYNSTSASVGTTTPFFTFAVPGNANGGGLTISFPVGLAFGTGIQVGITTGVADNDTGAPAANEVTVNIAYK